jgi:hypothetical protein
MKAKATHAHTHTQGQYSVVTENNLNFENRDVGFSYCQ